MSRKKPATAPDKPQNGAPQVKHTTAELTTDEKFFLYAMRRYRHYLREERFMRRNRVAAARTIITHVAKMDPDLLKGQRHLKILAVAEAIVDYFENDENWPKEEEETAGQS